MSSLKRALGALLVTGLVLGLTSGAAQERPPGQDRAWEMRVCAPPDAYPISSRNQDGFENRIAQILADQLDAELTFEWTRIDTTGLRDTLQAGTCDLVFGVLDGANGVMTTVPYHRAPFVFVYRSDAGFDITTINDEVLSEVRFAVEPNSFPQVVLSQLGHAERLVVVPPGGVTAAGHSRLANVLAALDNGEADVAIVYGPDEARIDSLGDYEVVTVQPEILPPFHQMFRMLTIGVRLNDVALRDRLNIALANSWEEVQAVLDEFGVPQLSVVQPVPPRFERIGIAIGAVFPMPSGGWALPRDAEGMAAQVGALVAEDFSTSSESGDAGPINVYVANAPTPEAAQRAARRLVATEGARALIGGLGTEQAQVLSRVAEDLDVPFFNIANDDPALRQECTATHTFHVAPGESMYLQGMYEGLALQGAETWFVVYEESESGQRLFDTFTAVLEQAGAELAGSRSISSIPTSYREVLAAVEGSGAQGVALLAGPSTQEFFLSQYRLDVPLIGYPHPEMQTRRYLAQLHQVVPESARFRVSGWDPQLQENGAATFNEVVTGRSGEPADLTAWTAFAAAKIAQQALYAVETGAAPDAPSYLASQATFELLKGDALRFGPGNQLEQPLYSVELDLDADYTRLVGDRLALARVSGELGPFGSSKSCGD